MPTAALLIARLMRPLWRAFGNTSAMNLLSVAIWMQAGFRGYLDARFCQRKTRLILKTTKRFCGSMKRGRAPRFPRPLTGVFWHDPAWKYRDVAETCRFSPLNHSVLCHEPKRVHKGSRGVALQQMARFCMSKPLPFPFTVARSEISERVPVVLASCCRFWQAFDECHYVVGKRASE